MILYLDQKASSSFRGPSSLIVSPSHTRPSIATISYDPDSEVFYSCSIVLRNSLFIFGGSTNVTQNQVSKLNGCRIQRIGSLDFTLHAGTCAVAKQKIFLCFDIDHAKMCHVGLEPLGNFTRIKNSNFGHSMSRIAAANGKDQNLT